MLQFTPCRITHTGAVIHVVWGHDFEAVKVGHLVFKDLVIMFNKNQFC